MECLRTKRNGTNLKKMVRYCFEDEFLSDQIVIVGKRKSKGGHLLIPLIKYKIYDIMYSMCFYIILHTVTYF